MLHERQIHFNVSSRFNFKFDNSGTMRFFRDNGMRENRRDMAPPLSKKSTEGEYQKLYRAAKEDKAWEDFLRMMGADIGASRSDLWIFENHARLRVCHTLPRRTCEVSGHTSWNG